MGTVAVDLSCRNLLVSQLLYMYFVSYYLVSRLNIPILNVFKWVMNTRKEAHSHTKGT